MYFLQSEVAFGGAVMRRISAALLIVYLCTGGSYYYGGGSSFFVKAISCDISPGELSALEALYDSTNGTNWNWRTADDDNFYYEPYDGGAVWEFPASVSDPCSNNWQGITCVNTSLSSCFIENLELISYNLIGTLPSNISGLTGLSYIDIRYNSVTGTIPKEMYSMTSMTYMRLYSNELSGNISCEISSMTNLGKISISRNRFTGSICSEISALEKLYFLGLFENSLTSTLPIEFSKMTALLDLFLYSNFLSGEIPSQLSTLLNLDYLYLNDNYFTKTIPSQLSALSKLSILELQVNSLSRTIPIEITALSELEYLWLSDNFLSGQISSHLSALSNLNYLYLYGNYLTKTIPSQLSALLKLTDLDFSCNELSGSIPPSFEKLAKLQFLYLNNNKLSGTISPSFSALSNLTVLFIQDNKFTNSISSNMFDDFKYLQVLDLSSNYFEGKLPDSLKKLSTLIYIAASDNTFTGDPFFFLGFSAIQLVNVSYNRFDNMDSLRSAAAASHTTLNSSCLNLTYLDISNNYLNSSFPDRIGAIFPNLTLLSASNNRLLSYIPDSFCDMKHLQTLLLSGLGNRTSLFLSQLSQINHFTIPSCLLSLPFLETAHLVSNALYGTLGEVGANMVSLSLVGNQLFGNLPVSLQGSSRLNYLQLSLNRLSGTLTSDAFLDMANNSIIDLYSNRISGTIPSSMSNFGKGLDDKPNILTGNVFYCKYGARYKNLEDYDTYSCGSSAIDFFQYIYVSVAFAIAIVPFILWICWRKSNRSGRNDDMKKKKNVVDLFIIYFRYRNFPTPLFNGLVSWQFVASSLVVALFMVLFNVGYTLEESKKIGAGGLSFAETFSTVFDRYGWTSAFIFVHGMLPFCLVVLGLSILLFFYLYWLKVESAMANNSSDSERRTDIFFRRSERQSESNGTKSPSSTRPLILPQFSFVLYCKNSVFSLCAFVDTTAKRRILTFQIVNIAIVTGVNVSYIFIKTSKHVGMVYKSIAPVLLAMFKILWANTFVVFLVKYGIRSKLSMYVVFLHYVFALVYLYFFVSVIAVYVTSQECFSVPIGFYSIDPVTENFPSVVPDVQCICTVSGKNACSEVICPITFTSTIISQSITPSWIYGYQCGVRILTNFVPAVLSAYTLKGILIPLMKLVVLSASPRSWIRNNIVVKKMLLPFTSNAMSEDDLGSDDLGNDDDKEFRTLRFLSNLVTDLLMIFTYGVLCPFLIFLLLWTILVNEIINHIQIGSYVYDLKRLIEKEESSADRTMSTVDMSTSQLGTSNLHDLLKEENLQSIDLETNTHDGNPRTISSDSSAPPGSDSSATSPSKAEKIEFLFTLVSRINNVYLDNSGELLFYVWKPMLIAILFFFTVILFDMIADVYDSFYGVVCVVVFWIIIYSFFGFGRKGLDNMFICYKRIIGCAISSDESPKRSASIAGVELGNDQGNPLQDSRSDKLTVPSSI
jgi:hypothetical protein